MLTSSERASFWYSGVDDFFKRLTHLSEGVYTIQGISLQEFDKVDSAREQAWRKFRLFLYQPASKLLMITIPSAPHERLHASLGNEICFQAANMGLRHELISISSTRFKEQGTAGEGDQAFIPLSQRPERDAWPTLVIEAGWSQTWESLHSKAQWWFWASNGDVKIVILAKPDQREGRITLEKWRQVQASPRVGATNTRASTARAIEPRCVQTINITRAAGITETHPNRFDPASYQVTRGDLRLEFADLFLRPPIPPEQDIVINATDLQQCAVIVWRSVFP